MNINHVDKNNLNENGNKLYLCYLCNVQTIEHKIEIPLYHNYNLRKFNFEMQ